MAAQLNLAAGAEYCPAVDEAMRAGQLLLISIEFNGAGEPVQTFQPGEQQEAALILLEQLRSYNSGSLCR